ncbi:phosphatidate cytidylyltransferase [Stagonosporopsis vannaccii]|nr:phosphatidate cytidylyltransferase [Stagonosporopsis vannaccii]
MHESAFPDAPLDAPTTSEVEALELFRRSPHPYLRHRADLSNTQTPSSTSSNNTSASRTPPRSSGRTISDEDRRKRRKRASQSPSESGTEADDEGYQFVKALPAPPLRPRKGLRDRKGLREEGLSPLLTPTQIEEEVRKFSEEYFQNKKDSAQTGDASPTDKEAKVARQKYIKRRRNEVVRRATETGLLAGIGFLAVNGCECWPKLLEWHRAEFATHAAVISAVIGIYPLRLLYHSWRADPPSILRFRQRIRIPASFDPAPILYPAILPALISVSIFALYPKPLLANLILGLAALPPQLVPFGQPLLGYSSTHWFISILPLLASENTDIPSRLLASRPYKLKLPPPDQGLDPNDLAILFPLHQALLPPLYYLTTTSLLSTELHLLSIGLINLLLFATSPQAGILKTLMWLGGVALFLTCGKVLKWGVALARIPRWRFRRAGEIVKNRQSFIHTLNESLRSKRSLSTTRGQVSDSDADEDGPMLRSSLQKNISFKLKILDSMRSNNVANGQEPQSAVDPQKAGFDDLNDADVANAQGRTRRNTLPALMADDHTSKHRLSSRKRSKSIAQSYLSLTPTQAMVRKWAYAGYFYVMVVLIILGPLRYVIGKTALRNHEPFGWAISYLFGNVRSLRWEVFRWNLDWWIPLPPIQDSDDLAQFAVSLSRAEYIRTVLLGEANTRLLLCFYCAATIIVGLLSVLSLSALVEVDTRRKVFHGTMVAMLLPTIYIDPCFVSLALSLVLAIFLLLDLIRASQLPPLSRPIATFLTPYVDGRDLRGPVVVSHIFLLIGCAIPLWLSLAATSRAGAEPWTDWDVSARDVSMVAGVVCVGMGDAAASLIGRRYGRRKWPWAGGKSLEGSLAFAVAVTVGLVFARVWLHFGWGDVNAPSKTGRELAVDAVLTLGKAALCAAGASLNEAVLTGGNDNVIVPVVLWVLVRGVRL